MKKLISLILLLAFYLPGFSQSKCKFTGYTYSTSQAYNITSYCGGRHHRTIKYGEERYTTANFYDYTLKRMFYIQKREVREQYCYSWGYWRSSWEHIGFRDDFVLNKIYYFYLKNIEYTL